ncbi:MAG: EF-hand domain-containing protein [Sedimenticolaceae bacterium]|nr:EF-hand domain-containing protein [Sedimenticolaceae bacterium]
MTIRISSLAALLLTGCLASTPLLASEEGQTLAEAFKALDSDGDGFITLDEAAIENNLITSFEDGDDDEDGRLSLAEFSKMEIIDE